jgi:hypothetical protein
MNQSRDSLTDSDGNRNPIDLGQLEALLEELAQLAVQGVAEGDFFANVLHHLRSLLGCPSVALLRPTGTGEWITTNADPSVAVEQAIVDWVSDYFNDGGQSNPREATSAGALQGIESTLQAVEHGSTIACSFQVSQNSTAVILASGLEPDLAAATFRTQLIEAIAEIAYEYERDRYLRRAANATSPAEEALRLTNDLLRCEDFPEACAVLATEGRIVLGCDRVSVFQATAGGKVRPIAVTGADEFDSHSTIMKSLVLLANVCVLESRAMVIADVACCEDEKLEAFQEKYRTCSEFKQVIAFPLRSVDSSGTTARVFAVVILENQSATMQQRSHYWRETLPMVEQVLGEREKADSVPPSVRRFFGRRISTSVRRVRLALVLLVVTAACVAYLAQPVTVIIEADGVLKPVAQRHVFAPADGRVESIHVDDKEPVRAGQMLLQIVSPGLAMQQKEIDGRIRTLEKKHDSLTVAVSQTAADRSEQIIQAKIAAEVAEIEQEIQGLREQSLIVSDEMLRLMVTSPIAGRVVNWNFAQSLESRPVRRGDSLLKVADTTKGWRLEIYVPDGEFGHVRRAWEDNDRVRVDYVILSQPERPRAANLTKLARAVQYTDRGGTAVPVFADLTDKSLPPDLLGDSAVRARIHCAPKPRGFVWFRQIIESLQRRFWL